MANANDGVVDKVTVRSISLADLKRNKHAFGRHKDLEDLKHLHKKKLR